MDGNVLSILASLAGNGNVAAAGGMGENVLQALQPPAPALASPMPQAVSAPPLAPPPTAAPAAEAPKTEVRVKKRNSVIDVIGRLADTFATVGGAQALYQPTLDAREDRVMKGEDRAREIDMDGLRRQLAEQQVEAGELEPELAERKRIGTALGALAGNENAAALWPSVAAQAGITDPAKVAAIQQQLEANPNSASIFAKALGADIDSLGKNVFFGTDGTGKTIAYQVGGDGKPRILDFGSAGVTPNAPVKVVDTGGAQVIVEGTTPRRTLFKTAKPDTLANNRTAITIAGMPARAQPGKTTAAKAGEDTGAFAETARGSLSELRTIYDDLKKMGAMVSPSQGTGTNVAARLRASGAGQILEGAVGTRAQTQRDRISSIRPGLMQSIAKATGMTGKQLDSNADVKLFMQTVTNPASSYEANIKAIEGIERFIAANQKKPAAAAPAARARPTTVRPKAKDGWTIVKVK